METKCRSRNNEAPGLGIQFSAEHRSGTKWNGARPNSDVASHQNTTFSNNSLGGLSAAKIPCSSLKLDSSHVRDRCVRNMGTNE